MEFKVAFSRTAVLAELIKALLRETHASLDAALYRFNNPGLAEALTEAAGRGLRIRLVLDGGKFQNDPATRSLLEQHRLPFRLRDGRRGQGSKMHHKFVILDGVRVLTGSYNWTLESEQENYENLLVVSEPAAVQQFQDEFEALWNEAEMKT